MSSPSKPEGSVPPNDDENSYRLSRESPLAPEGIQPPPPVKNYYPKKNAKLKTTSVFPQIGGTLIGFNALVFVTNVCIMTLELTASRLIGKHVGSSLYTWTSVIGVVLAGITLGNWLGGWMADRYDRSRALGWMYLLGSLSCGSVLWLDQMVGTIPRPESMSWPAWVVTVVAAIFLLPALSLGTTSPLVASMALDRSTRTGSTVGNVYAWGALGSIFGTFLTGFYLIDVWGTRSIVGMTAATLAILAVIVAGSRRVFRMGVVLGWLQLLGWTMLLACSNASAFEAVGFAAARCVSVVQTEATAMVLRDKWSRYGNKIGDKLHDFGLILGLRDDRRNQYHDESNYFDICIHDSTVDGRLVKSLRLDKLIHSYYDPTDPTSLHYEYERVYAAVTKKVLSGSTTEPVTVSLDGLVGVDITNAPLPDGVNIIDNGQALRIDNPTKEVFERLLELAPEAEYWKAIDQLLRQCNKPIWDGFSSVSLSKLPEGTEIPDESADFLRHDETLGLLIAYQRLTRADRDRLITSTSSGQWYLQINELRRASFQTSACFYGGGGYIFPRWFLQEFPGSTRIDVAELDPAVHLAVTTQLGLDKNLEERIHTTIGDARNFVDDRLRDNANRRNRNEPPVVYDFIYADAFNDFSIPWHLTTREFLQKTHDLLSERGVFQANIIDIYPRTQFPGIAVGFAEADYVGRLPSGVLSDDIRRDKIQPANRAYEPLEVMELLTNRYQLQVRRMMTAYDEERLRCVEWPELKPPIGYDVTKGFQAEINTDVEKENWRKAISGLAMRSRKKKEFNGTIPEQLKLSDGPLESWVTAVPPFEFVESCRIDGDKYLLGFRGLVTEQSAKALIELDPTNAEWVNAVKTSAEKSRAKGAGRFMGRYVATAARVFPNIYLFSTSHQQPDVDRDTFVMVCSRQPIDLKSLDDTYDWNSGPFASLETLPGQTEPELSGHMRAVIALSEGQILTDDFAPVDNLLVPVFDLQE